MNETMTGDDLVAKNRRVLRALLTVMIGLAAAALLVGIKW